MKFFCSDLSHNAPAQYQYNETHFDKKADALEHLEKCPNHKVLTKHWWSDSHFGRLKLDGTIIIDEDY